MDFDKFIFRKSQSCTKSHNKIIVNIYVLIIYNISQRDKNSNIRFQVKEPVLLSLKRFTAPHRQSKLILNQNF